MVESPRAVNDAIDAARILMDKYNQSRGQVAKTDLSKLASQLTVTTAALKEVKGTPGFQLPAGIKKLTTDTLALASQETANPTQAAALLNAARAFERLLREFPNGHEDTSKHKVKGVSSSGLSGRQG